MVNWLDTDEARTAATDAAWAIANNMARWMRLEALRRSGEIRAICEFLQDNGREDMADKLRRVE